MVISKLTKILSEIIEIDENEITAQTQLSSDCGIELIDVAKLVMECENKFKMTIHDEDVHEFKTLGDIAEYIDNRLSDGKENISYISEKRREAWYYR